MNADMRDYWRQRYESALHAVQTGVRMLFEKQGARDGEMSPWHLRVGVNSAMIDSSAMASLLIKKGLITEEEYLQTLVEFAEKEKAAYEEKVALVFGEGVRLG